VGCIETDIGTHQTQNESRIAVISLDQKGATGQSLTTVISVCR
jgi:hypothetical protein